MGLDEGQGEETGAGSMLRASEGWKRGPSAGNGILGGGAASSPILKLASCGCVCCGDSGIEFGRGPPVSEVEWKFVRGRHMARVSISTDHPSNSDFGTLHPAWMRSRCGDGPPVSVCEARHKRRVVRT